MKGFKKILICLFLMGCGSEDNAVQNNTETARPLVADNLFEVLTPNTAHKLEIESLLNDKHISLTALIPQSSKQNPNCDNPSFDNKNIYFSLNAGDHCIYEYHVQKENETATAKLEIFSSKEENSTLDSASTTFILDEETATNTIQFNIPTTISDQGYRLDTNSLVEDEAFSTIDGKVIIGEPIFSSSNPSGFEIPLSYDNITNSGITRISFQLNSSQSPHEASPKLGYIYVTFTLVNSGGGTGPQIENKYFIYPAHTYHIGAPPLTIDLAALSVSPGLPLIEDRNGWEISMLFANTPYSEVALAEPGKAGNTSFTFTTTKSGSHIVSYFVRDPFDLTNFGQIEINVDLEDKEANWHSITHNNKEYFATPRYHDIKHIFSLSAIEDLEVENYIAGFNLEQAEIFCAAHGKIPTLTELENLRTTTEADFADWPKQAHYWALNTDSSFIGYSLIDGATSTPTPSDYLYLTCVKDATS